MKLRLILDLDVPESLIHEDASLLLAHEVVGEGVRQQAEVSHLMAAMNWMVKKDNPPAGVAPDEWRERAQGIIDDHQAWAAVLKAARTVVQPTPCSHCSGQKTLKTPTGVLAIHRLELEFPDIDLSEDYYACPVCNSKAV